MKGLVSRNRALERDVVAIKVLPPDQWQVITRHIPCMYVHICISKESITCMLPTQTEQRLQAVAGSQTASSHPTLQELAPSLGALKLVSLQ